MYADASCSRTTGFFAAATASAGAPVEAKALGSPPPTRLPERDRSSSKGRVLPSEGARVGVAAGTDVGSADAGTESGTGSRLFRATGAMPSSPTEGATDAPVCDGAGTVACPDAALPAATTEATPPAGTTATADGMPAWAAGGATDRARAACWTSSHRVRRSPHARPGNTSATSSFVKLANTRPVIRSALRRAPTRAATLSSKSAAITDVTAAASSASVNWGVRGDAMSRVGGREKGKTHTAGREKRARSQVPLPPPLPDEPSHRGGRITSKCADTPRSGPCARRADAGAWVLLA